MPHLSPGFAEPLGSSAGAASKKGCPCCWPLAAAIGKQTHLFKPTVIHVGFFFILIWYFDMICNAAGTQQHRFLLYLMTLTAAVPCQPTGCEAVAAAEQQLKELVID